MIVVAGILALIFGISTLRNPFIGLGVYIVCEYVKLGQIAPSFAKIHFARIIAIFLIISLVIKVASSKKIPIPKNILNSAQFYFLGVMAFSTLTAFVQLTAFETLKTHVQTVLLYFFIVILLNSEERFKRFIWIFIGILAAVSVSGLIKYFSGGIIDNLWVGGHLGGADDLALALSVGLPLAYYFSLLEVKLKKTLLIGIVVLFAITIILINARGGFLSLGGVIFFIYLTSKSKMKATIVAVFGIITILLFAPANFFQEFQSISDIHEGTAQNRLDLWLIGLKIFLSHPILGVGPMNYPSIYGRFYLSNQYYKQNWMGAHSDYITILSELGSIGFIVFIFIIFHIFKENLYIKRKMKEMKLEKSFPYMFSNALMISLGGYLIGGAFLTVIYYPHFFVIAALTVSLRNIAEKDILAREKYD